MALDAVTVAESGSGLAKKVGKVSFAMADGAKRELTFASRGKPIEISTIFKYLSRN
jgi:hypothetical protein